MLAKVVHQRERYTTAHAAVEYVADISEEQARDMLGVAHDDTEKNALIAYAARAGVIEAGVSVRLAPIAQDPLTQQREITRFFDTVVENVRARGVKADHPLYHVVITWQPGEQPQAHHVEAAVAHTMKAVGLSDAAYFWVIHRDKAHHHAHIVALKYDPETLRHLGPPPKDWLLLDKAMREIELAQGWAHSPGPFIVRDGKIVLDRSKREKSSTPEASIERAGGLPGIQRYAQAVGLKAKLAQCQDWQSLHRTLAAHGLVIEPKKGGFVIKAKGLQQTHVLKASAIDRSLAGQALTARLGAYEPPALAPDSVPLIKTKTFVAYQEAAALGEEPWAEEQPTVKTKRDPQRRAQQREARARARQALYGQWQAWRIEAPVRRREAMHELRERQRIERERLAAEFRGDTRGRKNALQVLRQKQKFERDLLRKQFTTNWREWLEYRATVLGDPAAIAALRGIRYREKRRERERQPGFEGEDVRIEVNGIEGAPTTSFWQHAKIEQSPDRTSIVVKDESGRVRLRDSGQRIDVESPLDDEAMIAALEIAAERFGGAVYITGDENFRRRAAKACIERGITVVNVELQPTQHKSAERDSALSR
jgi:hypothetical protein